MSGFSLNKVNSRNILPGTVGTVTLQDGSIATANLADGAVTAQKLAAAAVIPSKIKTDDTYSMDISRSQIQVELTLIPTANSQTLIPTAEQLNTYNNYTISNNSYTGVKVSFANNSKNKVVYITNGAGNPDVEFGINTTKVTLGADEWCMALIKTTGDVSALSPKISNKSNGKISPKSLNITTRSVTITAGNTLGSATNTDDIGGVLQQSYCEESTPTQSGGGSAPIPSIAPMATACSGTWSSWAMNDAGTIIMGINSDGYVNIINVPSGAITSIYNSNVDSIGGGPLFYNSDGYFYSLQNGTGSNALRIDTAGTVQLVGTGLAPTANGAHRGGVLGADGKFYLPPWNQADIHQYTPGGSLVVNNFGLTYTGIEFWGGGCLTKEGKIYFPPGYGSSSEPKAILIDTNAQTASKLTPGLSLPTNSYCYMNCVRGEDDIIYSFPYSSPGKILKFNSSTNVHSFGPDIEVAPQYGNMYGSPALGPDGKIYLPPYNSVDGKRKWAVFDPVANTVTYDDFGLDMTNYAEQCGAFYTYDGSIISTPRRAIKPLKLETNATRASRIPSYGSGTTDKALSGRVATNGKIFYPCNNGVEHLVLDPSTNTMTGISSPTYTSFCDAIQIGSYMYFLPYNSNYIGKCDISTNAVTYILLLWS